jgi:D-alanyl-D-alanine carboxypeptidase (penicillin-binding protein 5/6)
MMSVAHRPAVFGVLLLLLASLAGAAPPARAQPYQYTSAIVYEPVTDTVLYAKNADDPYPTASMVKMMTALVVADHIESEDLSWDDEVEVPRRASLVGGSSVYLRQGEVFTLRELMEALLIKSANDVAYLLAETAGHGSVEAFVEEMNAKADELELEHNSFYTPHGLPPEEPGQRNDVMSARDLALVGAELLEHPDLAEMVQTSTKPFRNRQFLLYNSNHLIRRWDEAIGIKTGWTRTANFCLTSAARRGDTTLIAVVMGAQRKNDSFDGSRALLERYLDEYELMHLVREGEVFSEAAVLDGSRATVPVVATEGASIQVRRGEQPNVETVVLSRLPHAPILEGDVVGEIIVRQAGREGYLARIDARAAEAVPTAGWWERMASRWSKWLARTF